MSSRMVWAASAGVLLCGCFDPEVAVGLLCGQNDECPGDQQCVDGTCLLPGTVPTPDAGITPMLSFRGAVDYDVGVNASQLLQTDLREDSQPDLIVAGGSVDGLSEVRVFEGVAGGSFSQTLSFPAGIEARSVAVGNIDGLGGLDVAYLYATETDEQIGIVLENPNNSVEYLPPVSFPAPQDDFWRSIFLTDFDDDGLLDVVLSGFGADTLGVLLQSPDHTFTQPQQIPGVAESYDIALADVNADGRDDLLFATPTGTYLELQSESPGVFLSPLQLNAAAATQVLVADMNADGHSDIICSNDSAGPATVTIILQDANLNGTFLAPKPVANLSLQPSLAIADMNRDSRADLISMTGPIAIQRSSELGTFDSSDAVDVDMDASPVDVVAGDWNRDGKPDIAVLHGEINQRDGYLRVFIQE